MRGLPPVGSTFRVRRWDAVVLGTALPGLVAAIRLGMRGMRVLILEEDTAAVAYRGLREPFMMTGSGSDGVLGSCLKALGIPLIDRRRIRTTFPAYQVAMPKARVDVGDANRTAEELEAWNLSPEATARNLVASLQEDSQAQQRILLDREIYTESRRMPRLSRKFPPLPRKPEAHPNSGYSIADPVGRAVAEASSLAAFCDAQLRALSDFAELEPPAYVRTRLLGAALGGAAETAEGHRWFRDLLDQRIASLYGEVRQLRGAFRLVSAGNQPAIEFERTPEVCAGRALIINAPLPALRDALAEGPTPDLLKGPAASHRRLSVHLRGPRRALPDGMAARVIRIGNLSEKVSGTNLIRLRVFENPDGKDPVDLVASAVVPIDAAKDTVCDEIESGVASLLPLGREGWVRVASQPPLWDRDEFLADPRSEGSRPAGVPLKPISRTPAYVLDRWKLAAQGFDGDLLLGWRAGDAIASDLA
ncbi:MAG: hypothetical protein JRE38_10180 [Deltaproteobacteria bacterium]|nr:hypothetical protein [Deltaproteobacteria bacterium]